QMICDIAMLSETGKFPGPWIFVNAWAIYDRKTEHPAGSYSNCLNHPFNQQVSEAVDADIDVVFCAGNCGGFCPSQRCGANDRGPGNSIFGATLIPKSLPSARFDRTPCGSATHRKAPASQTFVLINLTSAPQAKFSKP